MPKSEDWPRSRDSIFGIGNTERFHAKMDLGSWGVYPLAYLHAAEWLVGSIDSGANPDLIVFPALYLYRHYLELALKRLISMGCALDSTAPKCLGSHKLQELWNEARPLIEKHTGGPDEALEAVGTVVAEFAALDPFGEAFRYSEYKDGKETLAGTEHVCLDEIVRVMKRVDNFLVGAESVMDELRQHQADLEREYQKDRECF